jgi:hypothetical protein
MPRDPRCGEAFEHSAEHATTDSEPQPLDLNGRPATMVENERCRSPRRGCLVASALSTSLRAKRSNPFFLYAAAWIASRSLSSGAHSRDPLARNDGWIQFRFLAT